ncbi:hypothetical protein I6F35_12240 [Bradyrhizobium sp. BRP22]|uniref:primase-helicase family protein n=1 Tax=Bradyrhizobium sp. BRP22 TaxID=2793821 RepID=UPI001CD7376B|nr:primase-helicase family protein [Bradyrhizobium sp. BRP22]MCA1453981.1 hypothetical protein [Bradyrhizobium sp. BRP22]
MNAIGSLDGLADPTMRPTGNRQLDTMNERFFVVREGGKAYVGMFEHERGRALLILMGFADFRNLHMHQKVKVKGQSVPLGKWWLEHPKRRQYEGLIFQPGNHARVINGKLNLWRGWAFEPKPGDWSKLREHIRQVLCSSKQELFDYVMNWLAWSVQHPDERAEVVLVMRGRKGTGKGTLGNAIRKLFGQHALQISSSQHLVGRFNGHLRDCVFLFADEAFWPGDKAGEGTLKRIVTEPTIIIEGKYRDAVEVPNLLHIMMASNEDWIVPAGEHERRYVVFEVNDLHLQDIPWFKAINDQLENGGYGAMLHDLLHRDISGFHPRQLPKCNDLTSQQAMSLSPLDSWWVELIENGTLAGCDPAAPYMARSGDYPEVIKNDWGSVVRIDKHPGLYTAARTIEPRLRNVSEHKLGEHLKKQGCTNDMKVLRRRGWMFPTLEECRKKWEQRFPGWKWRHPHLAAWEANDLDDVPF